MGLGRSLTPTRSHRTMSRKHSRRTFDLAAKPMVAELWITVDNIYVVYVNGQKSRHGQRMEHRREIRRRQAPRRRQERPRHQSDEQRGRRRAIARLHIKTAGKKDVFIVTDEKTKIWRAEPRKGPVESWTKSDFDDAAWCSPPSCSAMRRSGRGTSPAGAVAKGGKGQKRRVPPIMASTPSIPRSRRPLAAQEQLKHFVVPEGF